MFIACGENIQMNLEKVSKIEHGFFHVVKRLQFVDM